MPRSGAPAARRRCADRETRAASRITSDRLRVRVAEHAAAAELERGCAERAAARRRSRGTSRLPATRPERSAAARRAASGSGSRSSRGPSERRSCATRRRSAASPARPSRRSDEPGRHVRLAVDRLGVEEVRLRILDVDEDRVVLGRPAALGARAVVVGPDDLVQEALAAEDLVEEHLAVVRLARVDVDVQRPVLREHPPRLAQPRLEKAEVVVEAVGVGAAARRPAPVAPAAEPGAVAVGIGLDREREPALLLAGVERRIDVDQREGAVRQPRRADRGCRRGRSPARAHTRG